MQFAIIHVSDHPPILIVAWIKGKFELDVDRVRRNSTNVARYLVGGRGPEYRRDDTSGTVRWYLYDGLGSVLGEVDPSGNVTSSRKYDVYRLVRDGNNPGGTSAHKFVEQLGHPSEDNTGLIYMRARYYDPAAGRFASQYPHYNGLNWHTYYRDNPTNMTDKNRCEHWDEFWVGLLDHIATDSLFMEDY